MRIAAIVIGVLAVVIIGILTNYGMFHKIKVEERDLASFWIVYQKHTGEYKEVGAVMNAMYQDLKDRYSINTTKGFGLYYDNPQKVAKDQCRSVVGCILEGTDLAKNEQLKEKYSVVEYPVSRIVAADFPFKGMMSIFIGIFRVYPKLGAYIMEKGYAMRPMFEMYDTPGKKITYGMSINIDQGYFDSLLN